MRAGELSRRVTLQRIGATTRDAYGQEETTWDDVGTYWAAIVPRRGKEVTVAGQLRADADYKVTLRYVAGVTPADRLRYAGRTLNIFAVEDLDEGHHTLLLLCQEIVSGD